MARGDFNPRRGDAYPSLPDKAAAKWLRDMCNDYLAEKATRSQVEEAIVAWQETNGQEKRGNERKCI